MRRRILARLGLLCTLLLALSGAACARPTPPHRRSVLFVGLDGADWQLLDELMAAGTMPNLAALARAGRSGTLTSIQPPLSPLVWTTMMTGVSPLRHGVLDFTQFDPATGRLEPIRSTERRVPAVWTMAGQRGRSAAVFGLWATWPAEPVRGLLVSDRFLSFTSGSVGSTGQPPPGIVYPPDRAAWALQALARAEAAVDLAAMRAYLPDLTDADLARELSRPDPYAHPVSALRRILVETRAYDDLARAWIRERRPDLAIVYFQGTDTLGHVFAPFAPPRQPSVAEEDFARYSRVPERYFAEIDRLLGAYRELAAQHGSVLMLASDHGFRWKEGRPERLSSAAAATAGRWHREEGIYLLAGPGIAASLERAHGRVDQVCATLLALLGLPPGQGLAGPPLPGAPSFHDQPVAYGSSAPPAAAPPAVPTGGDDVAKLRSLGYIGTGEPRRAPPGATSTRTPASYDNEGLLLRQAGRTAEAAAAFRRALALDPGSSAALWNLSELLYAERRDLDASDSLLVKALAAGLPEGAEHAAGRAIAYAKEGKPERSLRLLDGAVTARPTDAKLWLLRGRYRLGGHLCREAEGDFERSTELDGADALAYASLGLARLCQGKAPAAAQALRRSLELDPAQPEIRRALAQLGPG
jgi:tetratricopeptide (TPR) repeat protein